MKTLLLFSLLVSVVAFAGKTTKDRKPNQQIFQFKFDQKISGEEVYQNVKAVGHKFDDSEMNDVISYKAEITCYNAGGTSNDYCEIKKINNPE